MGPDCQGGRGSLRMLQTLSKLPCMQSLHPPGVCGSWTHACPCVRSVVQVVVVFVWSGGVWAASPVSNGGNASGASDQVLLTAAVGFGDTWCAKAPWHGNSCRHVQASVRFARCGCRGLLFMPQADSVMWVDHSHACWLLAVAVSDHLCQSLLVESHQAASGCRWMAVQGSCGGRAMLCTGQGVVRTKERRMWARTLASWASR